MGKNRYCNEIYPLKILIHRGFNSFFSLPRIYLQTHTHNLQNQYEKFLVRLFASQMILEIQSHIVHSMYVYARIHKQTVKNEKINGTKTDSPKHWCANEYKIKLCNIFDL